MRPTCFRPLLIGCLLISLSACTTAPPPAPKEVMPQNMAAPFPLALSSTAPRPMVVGETASFSIQSGSDGFAQLYLLRASGTVLVLAENLPVAAVRPRQFPDPTDRFVLKAEPPAGRDTALVIVTRAPFVPGLVAPARQAPLLSPFDRTTFLARLNRTLTALPATDWAASSMPVEIIVRH